VEGEDKELDDSDYVGYFYDGRSAPIIVATKR